MALIFCIHVWCNQWYVFFPPVWLMMHASKLKSFICTKGFTMLNSAVPYRKDAKKIKKPYAKQ